MNELVFVAIGGFIGAVSRFYLSKKWNGVGRFHLPAGTLLVNLTGAFLLGLFAGFGMKGHLYSMLGIGFMGAFTTFSTLQLEAVNFHKDVKQKLFYVYLLITYSGGLILAFIGMVIGNSV